MRTSGLSLAAVLTLATGIAVAQGAWGNVKSWTGTVTIEATDAGKGPWGTSTMTYRATGDFKISDDMMPDGAHMQWPMPGVEAMSDPKQAETVYDRWNARVVASYEARGVDESGNPFTVKCTADNAELSRVGVTIHPTEPTYVFEVTAPPAQFKCNTTNRNPNANLRQVSYRLTAPRKAPGPVTNTKTFTVGTGTVKVTYNMAPSR